MKTKKIWIVIGFVLFLLIILGFVFFFLRNENTSSTDKVVIKENVYVLSSDEENMMPAVIETDRILFTKPPEYKEGDILVSGITEQSPSGFIRKVVSVIEEQGIYTYLTEPAYLTDVFEEAHVKKAITLLNDGVEVVCNGDLNSRMLQNDIAKELLEQIVDNESDYQFAVTVEEKFDNEVEINGVVGYNFVIELEMDIEDGEIEIGMVAKHENAGILNVEYGKDLEWSFEKELFSKKLPNIQFMVGTIPIVVTNELSSKLEGDVSLGGKMGTSFELKMENVAGFKYDSKTNEVTEIKELNYLSDGIKWETGAQAGVKSSVGVSFHLISKLYDSTGADIAIGLEGKATGEVVVEPVELSYVGSMDLAIEPSVQGSIVVTVPIVDEKLADKPMFVVELPALWEKHWESSKNWEDELYKLYKNTYTTRFSDVHKINAPSFQFDFPRNWSVTKEEVNNLDSIFYEVVEIQNKRGVTVRYVNFDDHAYRVGIGRDIMTCSIERISDPDIVFGAQSGMISHFGQGNLIIAKIHDLTYGTVDGQYMDEWDKYAYALVPEEILGMDSYVGADEWHVKHFSFNYVGNHSFVAISPDGKFTKSEEKEIVDILSSFRVKGLQREAKDDLDFAKLINGDFLEYEGEYVATTFCNDLYGGGKPINSLIIDKNGKISGGNPAYSEERFPNNIPTHIVKQIDGSYVCWLTDESCYIIYPIGVIENDEYIIENHGYLKDTIYIRYLQMGHGGVLDMTFYLDN